eukprot:UN14659
MLTKILQIDPKLNFHVFQILKSWSYYSFWGL